jgi:hypothetical protein
MEDSAKRVRFAMLGTLSRSDAMSPTASRILRTACLAGILGVTLAAPAVCAAERKVIALSLVKGSVRDVPNNTVRVKEDDDVELRWTSDRPVTLHLHGYEIDAQVAPGKPSAMAFKAKFAGRFPVHEHAEGAGNHRPVLYVEVYP